MGVLIVGAGISGLATGYQINLLSSGTIELQVLEARSRAGGRIQNLQNASFVDFDMDLGGQDLFFADRDQLEDLLSNGDNLDDFATESRPASFTDCEDQECEPNSRFYRSIIDDAYFKGSTLANFVIETFLEPIQESFPESLLVDKQVIEIDYTDPIKIVATTNDGSTYEANQLVVAVPLSQLQKSAITFRPGLDTSNIGSNILETINDSNAAEGSRMWVEFSEKFYDDVTRINDASYWDASRSKVNYCTQAWENIGDTCTRGDETPCSVNRNKHFCRCVGPTPSDETILERGATAICPSDDDNVLEAIVETDGTSCDDWCAGLSVRNIITFQGNRCSFPNGGTCTSSGLPRSREDILNKLLDDLDEAYGGNIATESFEAAGRRSHFQDWSREPFIEMVNGFAPSDDSAYLEAVDGRIWFAGDYTRGGSGNNAGESGIEVGQFVYDAICQDDDSWRRIRRDGRRFNGRPCRWVATNPDVRCNRLGSIESANGDFIEVKASDGCFATCTGCNSNSRSNIFGS